MSSRSDVVRILRLSLAAVVAAGGVGLAEGAFSFAEAQELVPVRPAAPTEPLRVCADPNNMPFSNRAEEGFENRIAEVVADELGREVQYTWFPQRRGFIRNTLRAGECDVVISIPSSFELALPTAPYYRSTYVFVYPKAAEFELRHLDDAVLRDLRVGVHMVGDDYSNTPGAAALGRRGLIRNIAGYSIYGDYSKPHPPSNLIEAVAKGEVDAAIAWGPLAGYFAPRQPVPLEIVPVSPQIDPPFTPFVFDISMGVRRGADTLRVTLERVLEERAPEIRSILQEYGVPLVETRRAPMTRGRETP